jgi:DHA1 family multidrug resistance protein-like MFS transporter
MVASQTPKERLGSTLGLLQLAIYLGQSLGPTTGGFVADILGYRATFWLTAVYLTVSGLIVLFFVKEQFTPSPDALQGKLFSRLKMDFRLVAGSTLALVLGLRFALRIGLNMKGPVVPLIVAELIPADRFLGSASGFLSTISGISSALIAPLMGRLTERGNIRWLLLGSSTVAAVGMIGQAFAPTYWLMVAAEVFLGFGIGGTLATISTTLGRLAPEGRTGVVFGLDTLAVSLSGAIGPSAGGMLGDLVSLRAPLFVGGLATMAAGLGVFRLPRELDKRPEPTKMPAEAA